MIAPAGSDAPPVFGRHPVVELLRAGSRRVGEIAVLGEGRGPALQDLLALARSRGVKISYRTRDQLTAIAGTPHHQGVVARVAEVAYVSLEDVLRIPGSRQESPFLLALDQVQDPRNLGAILRSAEATGVHGVVVPKHRAVGLTGAVAKSAAGALDLVPVARETNLVRALEVMKNQGLWVVGAVPAGGRLPWEADLCGPICVVLGGEGQGVRPLVARACDVLLTVPMVGKIESLNVSAVASVVCYEVLRQRQAARREKDLDLEGPQN